MKRIPKRILSLCMAAALVVGAMAATPATTITAQEATEAVEIPTSCPAHPEHDGDCGYVEAVAGVDCTHEHIIGGENPCGYGEAVEAQPCTFAHEHVTGNENGCGYDSENQESCTYDHQHATEGEDACDYDGEEPESCTFVHQHVTGNDDGCGYDGQNEESCTYDPTSHTHDTDCGYLEGTPGTDCTHEHNEDCAYVEAVESAPCGHSCEQCTVGKGVIMLTNVFSSDATLKKVAGQSIDPGSEEGTQNAPITAVITVVNAKGSIVATDLEFNDSNATALLYTDDIFLQDVSEVTLGDGDTSLYIKVTAEDVSTELHYHVTVTRVGSEAPEITTSGALEDWMVGVNIPKNAIEIKSNGGGSGWTWEVVRGKLPSGVNILRGYSGTYLMGEPVTAEDCSFALTVKNNSSGLTSAPVEFTITIQEKSGVGFGGKEWHSIENESEKMTLLSMNHVFENSAFGNDNVYKGSILQNEMEKALVDLGLSDKESDLIKKYNLGDVDVTDALFWPLSIEEAEKLPRYQRAYSDPWWLRSPGSYDNAAYVGDHGGVNSLGYFVLSLYGIRPAFQLNLASVLFTSAATGGKSATVGSTLGALAPENIYKFTMKNQTIAPTFALDTVTQKGKEVTIAYSGAVYEGGENRTVSVLVENSAGIFSFYGKLKTISASDDESGSVKVTLPDGFNPANDTLQLFVEQHNGDNYTDFASEPLDVDLTPPAIPFLAMTPGKTTLTVGGETNGRVVATALATGIGGTQTFTIEGTALPAGLGLNTLTGEITVTNAAALVATPATTVTVKVTGESSGTATATVIITINPPGTALTLGALTNDTATVGVSYSKTIPVTYTGGAGLTFSATSLPSGLSIDQSTGVIGGTPTQSDVGAHTIDVTVTDGNGLSASGNFVLTVKAAPKPDNNGHTNSGSTSGSGGGSSSTSNSASTIPTEKKPNMPTPKTQSLSGMVTDGVLTLAITEQMAKDTIQGAKEAATKSGKTKDGIAVAFTATDSGGWHSIIVNLEAGAIDRLKAAEVKYIKIGSAVIDLTLDAKAIAEISKQSTGTVTFSAIKQGTLSKAAKAAIGQRPVFDLTIKDTKDGKTTTISNLGGGTATIGIAYQAASKEKSGNLQAVYVDAKGKPQFLAASSYTNGRLMFSRHTLSVYGVGIQTPAPAFTDTASHWAKEGIDFVASRGLLLGATATTFAPDTAITRGDLLLALGKLSGADVSGYTKSSFPDVSDTDPTMPYIQWAVEKGILKGLGNGTFGGAGSISRQDLALVIQNYAKATGYTLPVSLTVAMNSDNAKISAYAGNAVKALRQAGIMQNKGNNTFDPMGTVTRGEASVILRRYMERTIDESTARGWSQNDAGQRQYIDANGKALIGWHPIGSDIYHFDANGILTLNTTVDGYEIGADGARK